jgi:hypothetical protein
MARYATSFLAGRVHGRRDLPGPGRPGRAAVAAAPPGRGRVRAALPTAPGGPLRGPGRRPAARLRQAVRRPRPPLRPAGPAGRGAVDHRPRRGPGPPVDAVEGRLVHRARDRPGPARPGRAGRAPAEALTPRRRIDSLRGATRAMWSPTAPGTAPGPGCGPTSGPGRGTPGGWSGGRCRPASATTASPPPATRATAPPRQAPSASCTASAAAPALHQGREPVEEPTGRLPVRGRDRLQLPATRVRPRQRHLPAGCVSLNPADLVAVLRWLRPGTRIVMGPSSWLLR